jgi:cytidylate kinase
VVAPREWRIRAAAERLGVPPAEAATITDDTDRNRARYHRQYYERDWNEPASYHMLLNTAALGLDGAAEVIVGRARALGW